MPQGRRWNTPTTDRDHVLESFEDLEQKPTQVAQQSEKWMFRPVWKNRSHTPVDRPATCLRIRERQVDQGKRKIREVGSPTCGLGQDACIHPDCSIGRHCCPRS